MRTSFATASWLTLAAAGAACSQPYGDLPSDRFPPDGWADLTRFDTAGWAILDVTDQDDVGASNAITIDDPATDAATKIEAIISTTSGSRILFFPAGTYYLQSHLQITDPNIILRGVGMVDTHLRIGAPSSANAEIEFRGVGLLPEIAVETEPSRGDDTFVISDSFGLGVGDYLHIFDKAVPAANGYYHYGQIIRIDHLIGDKVTSDMALGLDFGPDTFVAPVWLTENIGIEDLSVSRDRAADDATTNNIEFAFALNAFASSVESRNLERGGITAFFSRDVIVEGSMVHDAFDYGGGGQAYGILLTNNTTRCRITDNKAWSLRHHIILQRGANHCVVSYNSTEGDFLGTDGDLNSHSFITHNLLFEGNMGRRLKWDRRSDSGAGQYRSLYLTAFRNKITTDSSPSIVTLDPNRSGNLSHQYPTIVGNVTDSLSVSSGSVLPFVGANRVAG